MGHRLRRSRARRPGAQRAAVAGSAAGGAAGGGHERGSLGRSAAPSASAPPASGLPSPRALLRTPELQPATTCLGSSQSPCLGYRLPSSGAAGNPPLEPPTTVEGHSFCFQRLGLLSLQGKDKKKKEGDKKKRILKMPVKPLSSLTKEDIDETVLVQVNRKWEFRGSKIDGPVLHVDMILTDAMGNAIYAEVPGPLVETKADLLQIEKVYTIKRFKIVNAKSSYRCVDEPLMMYITYYSEIKLCRDPPSTFPQYIYRLSTFNEIDPHGPKAKDFHDVLGIITEVSPIESRQQDTQSSTSKFRNIWIKDLSDNRLRVTLWGQKALDFSYDSVYDPEAQTPIVVLFVGCLPKEFRGNTYLSGSAACYWYFNPAIQEANSFYNGISSKKMLLELPPTPTEELPAYAPPEREHMQLREILDRGPYGMPEQGYNCTVTITGIPTDENWWYPSCVKCLRSMNTKSTIYECSTCGTTDYSFRYKLTFTASDGTAESRMFCHENIARTIVGKPCSTLITSVADPSVIPPLLAAIVTLKFTFNVIFTERSFYYKEKTLLIKSIITTYGRVRSLPQLEQAIDLPCPSTPDKAILTSKPLESPSFAMSKLSTAAASTARKSLTYSPVTTTPSKDSTKHIRDTQATSSTSTDKSALPLLESPPKRLKYKDLKDTDKELAISKNTP